MNAVIKPNGNGTEDLIRVLQSSLYPGAKRESVELVLSYCRLNELDPMLKPVHIVPQSVKVGPEKWETRDTLMPGIGLYRILAARSGQYGGKSEPEFGPTHTETIGNVQVTYPEWCRVTISRIVQGQARTFAAVERWLENYATAGRNTEAPNAMWRKRAFGQLAKCAEAQALRMAFPEFSGAMPTAEEMEGKETFNGPTIEAAPEPQPAVQKMTIREWLDSFEADCQAANTPEVADAILKRESVLKLDDPDLRINESVRRRALAIRAALVARIWPQPPDDDDLPEVEIAGQEKVSAG